MHNREGVSSSCKNDFLLDCLLVSRMVRWDKTVGSKFVKFVAVLLDGPLCGRTVCENINDWDKSASSLSDLADGPCGRFSAKMNITK